MPTVDLHAHVLPGVDDGPPDLDGALAMARAAVAAGTAEMVATPHVNAREFIAPEAIAPAVEAFRAHLAHAAIPLRLHAGAEIALPSVLELGDAALAGLTLGGGGCLLLESPLAVAAGDFEPVVLDAQRRGYRVLLAHPERSAAFLHDPQRLTRLVEQGILVQLTAGALTGTFGRRVREFALRLLRADQVHVVASDAHSAVRRPPGVLVGLREAEAEIPGLAARAEWLSELVPRALLAGAPLPRAPALPQPRGWARARAAWSRR